MMVLDLMNIFLNEIIQLLLLVEIEEIMVVLLMEHLIIHYMDGGEIEPVYIIMEPGLLIPIKMVVLIGL